MFKAECVELIVGHTHVFSMWVRVFIKLGIVLHGILKSHFYLFTLQYKQWHMTPHHCDCNETVCARPPAPVWLACTALRETARTLLVGMRCARPPSPCWLACAALREAAHLLVSMRCARPPAPCWLACGICAARCRPHLKP